MYVYNVNYKTDYLDRGGRAVILVTIFFQWIFDLKDIFGNPLKWVRIEKDSW